MSASNPFGAVTLSSVLPIEVTALSSTPPGASAVWATAPTVPTNCRRPVGRERLVDGAHHLRTTPPGFSAVSTVLTTCETTPPGASAVFGDAAHRVDRVVHGVEEAADDLRVPVEGGERAVHDGRDVVEPHDEVRLHADVLDGEPDLVD